MLAQAGPTPRGFDPGDATLKYDLVIANADVLDPSQRLRGKRDIGIKNGQVAALSTTPIPTERATQRYDAGGRLTTPGLVDLHTHYGPLIGAIGLPADELVPITATTTGVSAGDAGANNFGALKHWVIGQARTRLFAFVHISSIGLSGGPAPGEMLNIDYANVDACARALAENPDVVLGVKVRITDNVVGTNGVEPLRRARRAAELAGKDFRVMCHIGAAPGNLADVLDLLRPGDILTHSYSGAGNTVCEPAMMQGCHVDTISSDIHAVSINTPGYPTLPWVMSKFLAMGVSLEEVVQRATIEPAKIIGRVPGLGTLAIGAPADVAIFDYVDGPAVEFVDTRNNKKSGTKKLVPVLTVREGRPFGRPYPIPFRY
jgi:dihydroorotase